MREAVIADVLNKKIIAIVRGVYGTDCLHLAEALDAGGIHLLEVTFDQAKPDTWTQTADTIELLTKALGNKMTFGAGTVTSIELLQLAKGAGARFIVSPDVNEAVIKATVAGGMVSMPGALTPTEALAAHRYGADFVKLFPAGSVGPGYLKAVHAPINHVRFLAVGGINENNLRSFLDAGAVGAGVGGNLVNKQWIADGAFEKITALARRFVQA